jgi:ABC-type phosphate transport system permease subunit
VSRSLGETAPVLLTTFHAGRFPDGLLGAAPTLPVAIWLDAAAPHDALRARAWATSLVLLALAVALRTAASLLGRRRDEVSR